MKRLPGVTVTWTKSQGNTRCTIQGMLSEHFTMTGRKYTPMKSKMQRRGSSSVRKNRHPPCEVLFLCSLRILAFNREKTEMPVCRSLLELRAYGPAPYADGETDEVDASALPLDPIEVAGQMRIAELWSAVQAAIACGLVCLLFAEEAFRFVLDGDFFERQVKRYPDTVTRTHTETARKWKSES
jgi:hypothetical protein